MAEDVPTIDFPLRPEALENDRKFQKLQKDLLTERQILEDWQTRGVDEASIKQQEVAVEAARQKLGTYLDEGYGAKQPSDLYGRSIYESGQKPALEIEHGFDGKTSQEKLSLIPKEETVSKSSNDNIVKQDPFDLGKPEEKPTRPETSFERSKDIALKISRESMELNLEEQGRTPRTKTDFSVAKAVEFSDKLRSLVQSGNYKGALEHIAASKPNTIEGVVAKLLAKLNDDVVTLSEKRNMVSDENGVIKSVGGAYLPTSHSVLLSHLTSGDYKTFIHEAVHSATSNVISRVMDGNTHGLGFREKWAATRLIETFEQAKKLSKNPDMYGFKNPKEFLSEVFSSNAFRQELKSIQLPGSKWSNMFHKMVDEVRQILGLPDKPNYNNALERAIHHGANIIEHSQKATREGEIGKRGDNTLRYQDNAPPSKLDRFSSFEEFKNSLSPEAQKYAADYWVEHGRELPKEESTALRNQAESDALGKILGNDQVKYLTQDVRSAEEIVAVINNHKDATGKPKDVSSGTLRNMLASGGWALSNLAQHPLTHWVTSKTMKALKEAEIKSDEAISERGTGFLAQLRGTILNSTDHSRIKEITAKMQAMEGKGPGEHNITFTPWEQKIVDSFRKATDTALAEINEIRASKGQAPIKNRPNYLAAMFTGDFKTIVQKDGKTVGWINGNSKIELREAMKKFEGMGYTFGEPKRTPYARSKQFQQALARKMETFHEMVEVFGKDDVDIKEFSDRMESMYQTQAQNYLDYKQHFKNKIGVFGAEGNKVWKDPYDNAIDLWTAQAEALRAANLWIAQQRVQAEVGKVLNDPKIVADHPNAAKAATILYEHHFGRDGDTLNLLEKGADAFVALLNSDTATAVLGNPLTGKVTGKIQGFNPFSAMTAIKKLTIYSTLGLNGAFAVTQFAQVPQATATMIARFKDLGLEGSATRSAHLGMSDTIGQTFAAKELAKQFGMPEGFITEEGKFFNEYATKNHIATPHILEKTDLYSKNATIRALQKADEIVGKSISHPEEVTRRATFNILAHYLFDSGIPKEKAAEMAEIATSIAMVDYSAQGRPMVYNKLGLLGQMAATVTTFKHNAYTQLATYAKYQSPRALATMVGMQLFMGGLLGMYAVDEVDQVLKFIYGFIPGMKATPSVKEYIMRETPEALAYGGPASMTGLDFSSKFALDNMFPDSLSEALFPLISSVMNTGKAVGKFASAPTLQTAAGVAYPLSPAPIKGALENTVFSEGNSYINPKTDKKDFERTEGDKAARLFGFHTMKERKASDLEFQTRDRELRLKEQQDGYLEKMRTYARAKDMDSAMEVAVKWAQGGGNVQQLPAFFTQAAKDRIQDKVQRLNQKSLNTVSQQQKQMHLQQFKKDTGTK